MKRHIYDSPKLHFKMIIFIPFDLVLILDMGTFYVAVIKRVYMWLMVQWL